jgi:6-phosphofructokinase 2
VTTRVDAWQSTAGAGDTFLAALLLALVRGQSLRDAACYASAAAVANLQQVGCGFFDVADVDRFLTLTEIEPFEL